jgi:hypothetical protein
MAINADGIFRMSATLLELRNQTFYNYIVTKQNKDFID